jgi:diacylglycerol kinase
MRTGLIAFPSFFILEAAAFFLMISINDIFVIISIEIIRSAIRTAIEPALPTNAKILYKWLHLLSLPCFA